MRKVFLWGRGGSAIVATAIIAGLACGPSTPPASDDVPTDRTPADATPDVVLETTLGAITLELDRERAPETVANFLRHVRSGFYDGLTFHRVRPGFMIQAGAVTPDRKKRTSSVYPVANEADNGLRNVRGALAMARTSDPHSATSEFFINVVDNPALDFKDRTGRGWGYAVFGRVRAGMEVVDAITAVPTERWRQHEAIPLEPVVIERVRLVEATPPTG